MALPYPRLDNAAGVWTLNEAYEYTMGGYWPNNNAIGLFVTGQNVDANGPLSKITMSTAGNATVFGDLARIGGSGSAGVGAIGSFTRGIFGTKRTMGINAKYWILVITS